MRRVLKFAIFFAVCFSALSVTVCAKSAWEPPFAVKSHSVYLVNEDTGTVVYSKNASDKLSQASITKLMTAILTVEHIKNLDETVTLTYEDIDPLYGTDSSTAGLVVGEQASVRNLLYCLLLPSSAETANCLARVVAGSTQKFVQMMNQKAAELGCKNTHYVNAHGLTADGHYSTAYDTYLIARYAMKYALLRKIVATTVYYFPADNKDKRTKTLISTNKMLFTGSTYYYAYCKGIKTGHTDDAGNCIVSYAKNGDYTYYCVVLGAPINKNDVNNNVAMAESKKLYEWAFSNFKQMTLVGKNDVKMQVNVKCAWNKDSVLLYPKTDFSAFVPASTNVKDVKTVSHLPKSILAPVKAGQAVGTADIYLGSRKMGAVTLVAKENVARSEPLYLSYLFKNFMRSGLFKVLCAILIGLFIAYLVTMFLVNRRRRKNEWMRRGRRRSSSRYHR